MILACGDRAVGVYFWAKRKLKSKIPDKGRGLFIWRGEVESKGTPKENDLPHLPAWGHGCSLWAWALSPARKHRLTDHPERWLLNRP